MGHLHLKKDMKIMSILLRNIISAFIFVRGSLHAISALSFSFVSAASCIYCNRVYAGGILWIK